VDGEDCQTIGGAPLKAWMSRWHFLAWSVCFLIVGGCGSEPPSWTPVELGLGPPELVVSVESGILAAPMGLALGPNGGLYVLDRMDRRVVRLSADGSVDGTMGGPGEGPGELTAPLAFGISTGDSVRVFDFAKGSILVFSGAGTFVRQYRADIRGIPSRVEMGPDGQVVYAGTHPTGNGALLAELDQTGAQAGLLGTLIRDETEIPPNLLDQVHERVIPEFMHNNVLPERTLEGGTWLFHQTQAVLEHITADGVRDVHEPIDVPEMAIISDAFFDWYAGVQSRDMLRYFEYAEDLVATSGSVWVLWQTPANRPGLITLHGTEGRLCARFTLQGVEEGTEDLDETARPPRRRLAVDESRSRAYVLDQTTAQVWAYPMPDSGALLSDCDRS